nr:hypothetical protein CFP56_74922 [Quercus suber]
MSRRLYRIPLLRHRTEPIESLVQDLIRSEILQKRFDKVNSRDSYRAVVADFRQPSHHHAVASEVSGSSTERRSWRRLLGLIRVAVSSPSRTKLRERSRITENLHLAAYDSTGLKVMIGVCVPVAE